MQGAVGLVDNASYSLDLLGQITADLADGHERFEAYLVECGFVAP